MGRALTGPAEAVARLERELAWRLRFERAARSFGASGVVVVAIVLLEELLARIVPLPDLRLAAALLLALPLAVGAIRLLAPPSPRAVARRAGELAGDPGLFLAAAGPAHTRLHPLVLEAREQAAARVLAAPRPPRAIGSLPRLVPLLYLPAVLAVAAPGRLTVVTNLPAELAAGLRAEARAATRPLEPLGIGEAERRRLEAALADPAASTLPDDELARLLRELDQAAREARTDWRAFLQAVAATDLLDAVARSLQHDDREGAATALRELAERLRRGEIAAPHREAQAQALLAAAATAGTPELQELFRRAGAALQSGDGSGAAEDLARIVASLARRREAVRAAETVVVRLAPAAGAEGRGEGAAPSPRTDGTSRAPGPSAPAPAPPSAFLGTRAPEHPVHATILRRYFDEE